jgi:PhzF family phenazine biosynthesis protein
MHIVGKSIMGNEQWINFWVVDTFTKQPFQGNPAGVVLEAKHLSAEQMCLIAREIGTAETAFVLPPQQEGGDLELRWFTPTCELPFSGHATVAALHVVGKSKGPELPDSLTLNSLSGPLKAWFCPRQEGTCPMVEVPLPHFEPVGLSKKKLADALLTSEEALHPNLPFLKDNLNLVVPLRQQDSLLNLYPDFRRLSQLGLEHDITGFICFSTQTSNPSVHWGLRFFAPGIGISEDPVSGIAHATAAVYLAEQGLIGGEPGSQITLLGEQGNHAERYGRVHVECIFSSDGRTSEVRIGGLAITVIKGQLRIS